MNRLPPRPIATIQAFSLLIVVTFSSSGRTEEANSFSKVISPSIQTHCIQCHGADDDIEGDVDLAKLDRDVLVANSALIKKLIDVLDQQEMPPEDSDQPTPALRKQMVAELKNILRDSVADSRSAPRTPIRRMNRFQYNNAVIDLFELKPIVFTLPERMMREHKGYFKPETGKMADVVTVGSRPLGKSQMIENRLSGVTAFPQDLRAEHGFDNQADHLTLSPLLMEAFLKLGQSITHSPDFVPKNVGIWATFFRAPPDDADLVPEIRARLRPFLTRAFRRPVNDDVLRRYSDFVETRLDAGVEFQDAMKSAAAAAIASPKFLYLYDVKPADRRQAATDDFALASRMSFFLWGSIPDQKLIELASKEQLHQPEILDAQFQRMIKDHRLKRFCDSFPSQWLQLERIISSVPNRETFPDFYFLKYRDSMHMMLEPLLLFETVLIENQPVTQLIDSDFTYRSTLLEAAYGELASESAKGKGGQGVTVLKFHRMPVTDRRNGGLITNAAVMTMTSGPDRTQPITRGAWIAGVIFNDPPDPPPANVEPLPENPPEGEEDLTLRERLAMHRERSDCRGCHEQIDPLGFALENYNPIGVWRDEYENGRRVDNAGTLFRRHEFNDIGEFKDAILAEKSRFTHALAGHLLSFALARELSAADTLSLEKITEATVADDYKIQTLLKQVVLSKPFRHTTDSSENNTANTSEELQR